MIVVDASAAVAALVDAGGVGALARHAIGTAGSLHAPHLLDVEVAAALRLLVIRDLVPAREATEALADLPGLGVQYYPHQPLLARSWSLRENLTAYDACYVALAELLGADLLTGDGRLARAPGRSCAVRVLKR